MSASLHRSDLCRATSASLRHILHAGFLVGCVMPAVAWAQTGRPSPEIIVTAPGPETSDAPSVGADQIEASGRPDLLDALTRNLADVSRVDAQDNPFQPDLVYHGFVASPLQGTAQGLAVYVDGARFNQPFGDTVDFDLLPEAAIERVHIADASPIYGLNALGGALVVATKTGRDAPGVTIEGAGGSYHRAEGSVEAGAASGPWSGYIAASEHHDGGWRRHSPSTLYNGYADLGYDSARAGVHLKLIAADSDLTGNGSSPVELLTVDRRAVFTYPDNIRNQYARVSVHPWAAFGLHTRIEASLYAERLRQGTINGDNSDVEPCNTGLLCLESDTGSDTPLLDTSGRQIADTLHGAPYGVLNRTHSRTTAGGVLMQLVDTRKLDAGENRLTLGFSQDRSRTAFSATTELGALTEDRSVAGLGETIDQPDGSIAPVSVIARTRYSGLFALDELPIVRGLSVEMGLRYNIAKVDIDDRLGTALDGEHRYGRLDPGVALDYRLSAGVKLRAGYAETNRAPTPAELACAGPDDPCSLTNFFVGDPALKQVVAKTWEAGASGDDRFDGWSLNWSLSAYRADNHDDIQFIASTIRGRAYFQNVGETRRQGIDASLAATRGRWTARAGYALTDATFRTPLTLNSPDNPAASADGTIHVAPGDHLPGVPRHRATVSLDYAGGAFTLGGDIQAQSGQWLYGDEANLQPKTAAFALVDLRGSVDLGGPVWLFGEVDNLFDRHYATFGTFSETDEVYLSEAPGATDPRALSPGAPRRWLVGLRAHL